MKQLDGTMETYDLWTTMLPQVHWRLDWRQNGIKIDFSGSIEELLKELAQ